MVNDDFVGLDDLNLDFYRRICPKKLHAAMTEGDD